MCAKCPTCQRTKKTNKKFGHVPPKEAEATPWAKLCVDTIGPYVIQRNPTTKKPTLETKCLTMIDPATGWFEAVELKGDTSIDAATALEKAWLSRYPWPQEIIYDRGTEFMADFGQMVRQDYGIKTRTITT